MKLPPIVYTLIFALLFLISGYFTFTLSRELSSAKDALKALQTNIETEITEITETVDSLKTDFSKLQDSDTQIISDIEILRKTKADINQKKNDEKNAVNSYSAERIKRKWAERYP